MALSKNSIKRINALRQKKYRQKYNKFVVEGDKMAREILQQDFWKLDHIYALDPWVKTHPHLLALHSEKLSVVSPAELKKISALKTPNQVLMIVDMRQESLNTEQLAHQKSLYLDGIQDPGNMGTILRIADWFGLDAVFCSEDCADLFNSKVLQSSMGAFLRIPTWRVSLKKLLAANPDVPVMGADLGGQNAFQTPWPDQGLLVIGSEGKGISPDNHALLTKRMMIPKRGGAESLNAGVACGVLCALWVNA